MIGNRERALWEVARSVAGGELDPEIVEFLLTVDRYLEPYLERAPHHLSDVRGLREGVAYQIQTGGKRIRAALCVTSCEMFGAPYQEALSFAAAIEHLQNFTLVHDDIADGDAERRSQASVWKRFGVAHAITIGDVFVPLCALAILESTYPSEMKLRLLHIICNFGMEVAEGQSLDINLREIDTPCIEQYLECTGKKTGSFIAMATTGGALIGGAGESDLLALKEFAILAGSAFQIKDDLLDLSRSKGRSIGSDILEGKRTLVTIYALQQASQFERRRLLRILNKPRAGKTSLEVEWVCSLYQKTGAMDDAERIAQQLIGEAGKYLVRLPESAAKQRLLRISDYLCTRRY